MLGVCHDEAILESLVALADCLDCRCSLGTNAEAVRRVLDIHTLVRWRVLEVDRNLTCSCCLEYQELTGELFAALGYDYRGDREPTVHTIGFAQHGLAFINRFRDFGVVHVCCNLMDLLWYNV